MPVTETQIVPFSLDYTCDKCGEGKMRPTGMVLMSHPAQYPHRCEKCDAHQNFYEQYPYVSYRVPNEQ